MEINEIHITGLRDCFSAGYTFPQYCIDNGFKKPLFVAEKKFWLFVWEIYVQFHYDKRMSARFSFLDADNKSVSFPAHAGIIKNLEIENISAVNLADFDAIIFLTTKRFNLPKAIYLDALTLYFVRKAYVEIPLLSFLQRHPKVKLFLTNYPNIYRYKDGFEFDSQLLDVEEFAERLRTDKSGNVKTTLDKFGYTNAQVLEISEPPEVMTKPDGSTVMIDDATKPLHNIQNGKRVTADQPEKFLTESFSSVNVFISEFMRLSTRRLKVISSRCSTKIICPIAWKTKVNFVSGARKIFFTT